MRITVLTVPECPHAQLAMERISAALAGRTAQVEWAEIHDRTQAAELRMNGSPTILLNGVDPFASPEAVAGVSCRLYRDVDGTMTGAPSVTALREALDDAYSPQATAPGDCCESDPLDVVGRAGRGRRAPAERGLRAVHQAVLRHFATTGVAPGPDVLEPIAASADRTADQVLAELAAEDFLTLDAAGRISAAYPFSAVPTRHRVRIQGGADVWSMCAIDALGVPAMLNADVVISSTDPITAEPVTVTSHNGASVWEPREAVVFVGQRSGGGPAATACCDVLNFFTSAASARTWTKDHPGVPGRVVDQAGAEAIARQTFGPVMAP